jgi:hypothetical protein
MLLISSDRVDGAEYWNLQYSSSMMLACWATARSLGPVAFPSFEFD